MKLIHIIESTSGIITNITSFVVRESDRSKVKLAEKLFFDLVKAHGGKKSESNHYDLSWSNNNGKEVFVKWSNSVID